LKHVFSALALAAVVVSTAGPAFAGDVQDFTIHNHTGLSFKELYVEPMSNKADWGDDLLNGQTMGEGSVKINFKGNSEECKYGIRVVAADGTAYEVEDIDLCTVSDFGFGMEGGKVVYAAE
jgi:hypothetical protein